MFSRIAIASGKITNAFATAQPILFYLISPEAPRLTDLYKSKIVQSYKSWFRQKSVKASHYAGLEVLPVRESDRADLILITFYQKKLYTYYTMSIKKTGKHRLNTKVLIKV